ncbi:glycerol-3-phosphate acyltransferase, chloroplastic isoform X1 [Helianthus annuus]|uniref:glycerol-3-phosphate acyltransferase, chloroplastic isoform X1 n=1 Tax=Helianthus annuus TaxID=4232 RepID=UPI000B906FF6|nr:glycerol-3-phosphate acyltransferase, chloroplastic isoform X1 [Helianthus annuus]
MNPIPSPLPKLQHNNKPRRTAPFSSLLFSLTHTHTFNVDPPSFLHHPLLLHHQPQGLPSFLSCSLAFLPLSGAFFSSRRKHGQLFIVLNSTAPPCFYRSSAVSYISRCSFSTRSAFWNSKGDGDWNSAKTCCSIDGGAVSELQKRSKLFLLGSFSCSVFQSGNPHAEEIVLSNMSVALDRILLDVKEPFEFSPYHEAIREPFNYYMFVQNYIRPLINFRESYVGNVSLFHEMEEQLKKGENVILISNHQTEADPVIISLLLETTSPHISETAIYVAGDRVVTDPLCKPFSMGRNLLCVYSKKHMNDVPELAEMKRRANTRSLKEMALLLRGGSKLIWIAASGGRDRPDPITNQWSPAPFDASAVDNMRRLVEHAGVPGHIYPLSLLCYDIMPPPPQVEIEIGERRVISFHGAGLSVAPKIDFNEITASCGGPDEAKEAYSRALYDSVCRQYNVLKTAIHGAQGSDASTTSVSLTQPWQLLN